MPLSDFQDQILEIVEDHFFADTELVRTVTWSLYKGRSTAASTFSVPAVHGKHKVGDAEMEHHVAGQQGERIYYIRESDLPSGVTFEDLTRNDVVTDAGSDFTVAEINKSLEFIIKVTCWGPR
jgi:hypothetical protein